MIDHNPSNANESPDRHEDRRGSPDPAGWGKVKDPRPSPLRLGRRAFLILAAVLLAVVGAAGLLVYAYWLEWSYDPSALPHPYRDPPYVPTPQHVVEKMLELAKVKKTDLVYDLGSGDGRIVTTAAERYGCRAVGFEFDEQLVEQSRKAAEAKGVANLVTFEKKDFFTVDLSEANVVALYLLPPTLKKLRPQLEKLKPGSRVVCHGYGLEWLQPDRKIQVQPPGEWEHDIYLYIWKEGR